MKPNAKPLHLESGEQVSLFQWAEYENARVLPGAIRTYMFSIPNGAFLKNARQAVQLKREGLRVGASDVFLAIPIFEHRWAGMFIELKKQRQHFRSMREAEKAVSDTQLEFHQDMTAAGYLCSVAYGWEEARKQIVDYLNHGR